MLVTVDCALIVSKNINDKSFEWLLIFSKQELSIRSSAKTFNVGTSKMPENTVGCRYQYQQLSIHNKANNDNQKNNDNYSKNHNDDTLSCKFINYPSHQQQLFSSTSLQFFIIFTNSDANNAKLGIVSKSFFDFIDFVDFDRTMLDCIIKQFSIFNQNFIFFSSFFANRLD